jgi:putative acetyltransferase
VIIREYDEVDLDDVLAIWERASRIAHFFLGEDFLRRERDSVANMHPRLAQTWVCVKGATIVGFIALVGNQVGGLFVDPAFQGEGIGRLLVDHARSLHAELELEVFAKNTGARRFYERYGFRRIDELIHEETGHPVVRMRLAHAT